MSHLFSKIHCLICLAFIALPAQSFAGDFATREIIGFSVDGSKFAFEEYGVQDGSGFAYSNIYLIDTKTDSWIGGSPWRIRYNDEDKSLEQARESAKMLAGNALEDITEKGFVAATNKYTEIPASPNLFAAHPKSYIPSGVEPIKFKLNHFDLNGGANCDSLGDTKGFTLSQLLPSGDEIILHKDTSIPNSRGCPLNYSFADIVTYYPQGSSPVVVVLILMQSFGFEGPDGRYIAVTSQF